MGVVPFSLAQCSDVIMASARSANKDDGCCSVPFLKYVLFIFNFVFLLAGCVVLGVGVWTVIDKHHYVPLLATSTYAATAYILILSGIIVILTTALGCIGIWKDNRCIILMYTFMLLLIFLLEAVSGIIAYVYEDEVFTELKGSLNETFIINYNFDEAKTRAIDDLQIQFKCCGAITYEDWQYSLWLKNDKKTHLQVPNSCCRSVTEGCGERAHPSNIYYEGCIKLLEQAIVEHIIILGAVGLGISVVQIFGMVFSFCLYLNLRYYMPRFY